MVTTFFKAQTNTALLSFFQKGRIMLVQQQFGSLGVLMFRMVCGYLPFASDDDTIGGGLHFKDGLYDGLKRKRGQSDGSRNKKKECKICHQK
ncbi:hypothetical protein AOLI_G00037290 [Acnodon oligacanthus]